MRLMRIKNFDFQLWRTYLKMYLQIQVYLMKSCVREQRHIFHVIFVARQKAVYKKCVCWIYLPYSSISRAPLKFCAPRIKITCHLAVTWCLIDSEGLYFRTFNARKLLSFSHDSMEGRFRALIAKDLITTKCNCEIWGSAAGKYKSDCLRQCYAV
jgi:hypothetical protein